MLNLQKGQHTVFISEEGGVLNEKSVLYLDDCCHGMCDDSIQDIAKALVQALEEYADQDETALSPMQRIPAVMPTATNGETVWKDYGNRYFTAKTTVTTAAGSGWVSLENHYTLSTNGIDERYGVANAAGISKGERIVEIDPIGVYITDCSARTEGSSDVNMYAEYCVKSLFAGQPQIEKSVKLETAVGYVSHNKTTKQIQVKQSWSLKA